MKNKFIWLITTLTLLFCLLIALDVTPLLRGPAPYPPDWQWEYLFINTIEKVWAPLLIMSVFLFTVYRIESLSDKKILEYEKPILLGQGIIFLLLQISVTYFSRAGLGVLVHRIINPDMNGYFTAALSIQNVGEFLHDYNSLVLSLPMHAQGHPPGAILFFWVVLEIMKLFSQHLQFFQFVSPSHADVAQIWHTLLAYQKATAIVSIATICFLSCIAGVIIYYIGKVIFGVRAAIRGLFFYLVTPSILFFIPINDIFLPLFSLGAFLLFIIGLQQEKRWYLFYSGFLFAVGIFFSLSIVPLLLIFFVYALLQKKKLQIASILGMYFSIGVGLLPFCLYALFGYNTILVSQTLMSGLPENRAYLTWVFYNLYDFFIFAGIPVSMLIFYHIKEIMQFFLKGKSITKHAITIGFINMLLILDISGSVRGEVARIWIPFYSFMVLIIGYVITHHFPMSKKTLLILLALQCVQILVMQESWVMLW